MSVGCAFRLVVWLDADGARWTTIVGKLTARLVPAGPAAVVAPDAIVPFDRLSSDPRFVDEAGEAFPFSQGAAVFARGGPLRLRVEPARVELSAGCTVELGPRDAVGPSMSAPGRTSLAPDALTRTAGGELQVPGTVDGHYFLAAAPSRWLEHLSGDERITLVTPAGQVAGMLPGLTLVARIGDPAKPSRLVRLRFDMLVLDGTSAKLSLVGRAALRGEISRCDVVVGPEGRLPTQDVGDLQDATNRPSQSTPRGTSGVDWHAGAGPREGRSPDCGWKREALRAGSDGSDTDETNALSSAEIAALRAGLLSPNGVAPMSSPPVVAAPDETAMLTGSAIEALRDKRALPFAAAASGAALPRAVIAATPFDAGYEPASVQAASGADETMPIGGPAASGAAQQVQAWLAAQRQRYERVGDEATAAAEAFPPVAAARPAAPTPPPEPSGVPAAIAALPAARVGAPAPADPARADLLAKLDAGERLTNAKLGGQDLRGLLLAGVWLDGADLRGADLRGVDLSSARLDRAQLDEAKLADADLSAASLVGASLRRALLTGAKLDGAVLDGSSLEDAEGEGASFAEVRASHVTLSRAKLARTLWRNATLTDAVAERADLREADLSGAALSGLRGASSDLASAQLSRADLSRADLRAASLTGAKVDEADLTGAILERASLASADLRKATLTDAKLRKANLDGVRLDGARMAKADLTAATAARATFDDASLAGAVLREVKAEGATFLRAVLQGADLERAELGRTSFADADARDARFRAAKLTEATLARCRLGEADLRDADLTGADVTDVEAIGARLRGAKLGGINGTLAPRAK